MKCVVCKLSIGEDTPFTTTPIGDVHIGECSSYLQWASSSNQLTESESNIDDIKLLVEDVQILTDD